MPIRVIAYSSIAVEGLPTDRLTNLIGDAAAFNVQAGVTGVLLYDGESFLQYLEGPEDGVRVAYDRVCQSSSHREIVELFRGRADKRHFPFWSMHCVTVRDRELEAVARGDWTGVSGVTRWDASDGALVRLRAAVATDLPSTDPIALWRQG